VTSGGTSGGIDMALHLMAKHRNERSARHVQLWVEYDPQPPFGPIALREARHHPGQVPSHLLLVTAGKELVGKSSAVQSPPRE